MNSYYETSSKNVKTKEKMLNYLLNDYYNNYNKLKIKFKLEDNLELNSEKDEKNEIKNNFDYDEFIEHKNNIYNLFLSHDLDEINNINYNIIDNLVNSMNDVNNKNILKNTQIKDDYNFRLNDGLNKKETKLRYDEDIEQEVDEANEKEIEEKKEKENITPITEAAKHKNENQTEKIITIIIK